ncbi:MAG: hypothetical protein CL678_01215 [Bdellovibrionaceae bacterium]|nr:hypothetical protein [Pseudobdellovibrionaceae bacterium]
MPAQIEGGVGGPLVSESILEGGHEVVDFTLHYHPPNTTHHISGKQLQAALQCRALSAANLTGVSFPPGSQNNNPYPVGVVVDQGLSNGKPRAMAPKTSRRFYVTQRGDATDESPIEDRSAVVGVSHVLPIGVDATTTEHRFDENIFVGDHAPPYKSPIEDYTGDEGTAMIKKACVWSDHHGESVTEALTGCVEAVKGDHKRIAVPLNQPTAISKLVTSKLELGAKKLAALFPTSRVDPDKLVHINNPAVHETELTPHVVLTQQDAEQAASKLVENLKPSAFHGGMNVTIHPLDGPISEPVTVNMRLHRKPITLPGTTGPIHMSHELVTKAIGANGGAVNASNSGADGAVNAIFAHDCGDGADPTAPGGALVSTSASTVDEPPVTATAGDDA